MINGIRIMNLEGSDILKNNLEGRDIYLKYNGVFTNSLLQDKLTEIGLRVNTKSESTRDIVNVEFGYGYTPLLENLNTETIAKLNHDIYEFKNRMDELENIKKSISKRKEKRPIIEEIDRLKDRIRAVKNQVLDLRIADEKAELDAKMNIEQVRDILYKNGFKLDFYKAVANENNEKEQIIDQSIEYTFWFRSCSKSRVGDAVFVNKKLYDDIKKWQRMGLELPEGEAKVVEMAAYEALTSSNIVDTVVIDPYKNILVIDDLKSFFETNCALVQTDDKGKCYVDFKLHTVSNTLFDGQALLDNSLWSEGDDTSFKLLRQHFFKACGFRTYIKKFMRDMFPDNYDTATVTDRYGNEVKLSEILMITTENAMKWEKFQDVGASYDLWRQKVSEDCNVFGVAKVDHVSKYNNLFDDNKCYQRMSYQHINTLFLEPGQEIKEMRELLQNTLRYIDRLKSDNEYFIRYLERTSNKVNANQMVMDLYRSVKNFDKSTFFRSLKDEKINEYVETVRNGKVLCSGDNLTIVGNPYIMLLHAIGKVPVTDGVIDDGFEDITLPVSDKYISVYAPLFSEGEYLASFRNPHNAPNNCGYNRNYRHSFMENYFNFNNNIMAVNLIHTELQDLKNGLDQDSDFCLVTNDSIVTSATQRVFRVFPCIVNAIEKDNRPYTNTIQSMVDIDNLLAKSKYDIGLSSNLAQLALSWYWEEKTDELAKIVCIMSVLAQAAIDNSKRQYKVDISKEIERISNLECINRKIESSKGRMIKSKPKFWKYVGTNVREDSLQDSDCPMDFLQDVLDSDITNASKSKDSILSVHFIKCVDGKADNRQMNKILLKIKGYDDAVKVHNTLAAEGFEEDNEKWKIKEQLLQKDVINYISGLKIKEKTMNVLISKALSTKGMNSKIKRKLLNSLYQSHRDIFMNSFKSL